jgi:DNA-binding NtrC family response regulator
MESKAVFIAYQDPSWLVPLSNRLMSRGYSLESSQILSEVLRWVRRKSESVLLLDDEMEGIKASDLIPLFKKLNPKIPIVLISSEQSIGFVKRLRGAGIFYQAMKPVDVEEIRSAVDCAFEKIEREQPSEGFLHLFFAGEVPA